MEISVVIITYNEEKRLEPALRSIRGIASEIIVVDSYSTDDTVKVAKQYDSKIFKREWTNYADQKNFANKKAIHPWILSLDADERLSPGLRKEILDLKQKEIQAAGFSVPRQAFYLGKWILHSGWYPDRKIRLFKKDNAFWQGEYVHEKMVVDGPVKKLMQPLYHFTYRDISDHLKRINQFSSLGAKKLYAAGKKCRWYHLVFLPPQRFLKSYFLKAGILDGFAGFVIAALHSYAIFARYAKLKEIWKKGERIEPFPN
ncbi:MAG: glycosyltransferase [Candidatus Aminicenantes bacterium]|nr:glycosyltransferase [Candidatus Aminicenantes bacterium]